MSSTFADGAKTQAWMSKIQDFTVEKTIADSIASFEAGDAIRHAPYTSNAVAVESADGTYSPRDEATSDETLSIDVQHVSSERIKTKDAFGYRYSLNADTAKNHGNALARRKDQLTFKKAVSGYTNSVTDGDMDSATNGGGTNAIISSTSNIDDILDIGVQKMREANVDPNTPKFVVLKPKRSRQLNAYLRTTGNAVMDNALLGQYGFAGEIGFGGLRAYVSNLAPEEAVLGLATQPTANDTVTVNGVTFTFVATPSAAGDVDLGGDVDASRANLAAAITGGAGAGSTYIEVSAANRKSLDLVAIEATNDDSANTLTVTAYGMLTVAETLTDGTDAWGSVVEKIIIGEVGSVYVGQLSNLNSDFLGLQNSNFVSSSDGMYMAPKSVTGFSGIELEVGQIMNGIVWNNYRGFGSVVDVVK